MLETINISFWLELGYYRREINKISNEVKALFGALFISHYLQWFQ